ncbi:MAG TPA: hypothetical protein VLM11_23685 [Streptosporangiaceae bacterium]|nr:hypothetical protein [Streptosporangiaceae bacterium]
MAALRLVHLAGDALGINAQQNIVPASVAAAGTAAIRALEDIADLTVAQEALAEWEADGRRTYRLADVEAQPG